MFRPTAIRIPAAITLAFCLALGGTVHHRGWSTCIVDPSESYPSQNDPSQSDSSQDSKPRLPARHHPAIAPATRSPRVRTTHLFNPPDIGFKFAVPAQLCGRAPQRTLASSPRLSLTTFRGLARERAA